MTGANDFIAAPSSRCLDMVFSSTMENIDRACDTALAFLEQEVKGIKPYLFSIHLGMREGLTNAVRHGNRGDASKKVTCRIYTNRNQCLEIDIEDQGAGFDWKEKIVTIPDEGAESGRGLAIMAQYFTSFRFNDQGNRLTLSIQRPLSA